MTTEAHPACIGSYEITGILGQGGMGIVYSARDCVSGQRVALKTVLIPDESLLQSIRREIQALARIEHPGIIRIVDVGMYEGKPWYAMEYLEATTLGTYFKSIRDGFGGFGRNPVAATLRMNERDDGLVNDGSPDWWTSSLDRVRTSDSPAADEADIHDLMTMETMYTHSVPGVSDELPKRGDEECEKPPERGITTIPDNIFSRFLECLIDTMIDLCNSLAYLHGNGIVHRDIKPQNIMVREDGTPVIVDFGLVAFLGSEASRDVLSGIRRASGTLLYMAPEQFRNEQVDARADLYSLGCILYECLLGQSPYPRDRIFSYLASTMVYEYPLPSQIDSRFPPSLDILIMRLLTPDPRFRLGYAIDVVTALREVLADLHGGVDGAETGGGPARGGRSAYEIHARPYLYRPGFTGRTAQIAIMKSKLDSLIQGHGGVVFIGGESGVGKTRFAQEVCRMALARRALAMTGECRDQRNRPLEAMSQPLQWIADFCRSGGRETTERIIGHRAKVLGVYEPAMMDLPGSASTEDPVALDPDSSRMRLLSYLREVLVSLATGKPTLLLLDDLQWADGLTLHLLRHVQDSGICGEVPLLILGTYRIEEMNDHVQALTSAENVLNLSLKRLDREDAEHIIGDMLALYPPPRHFTELLHRHAEGNPFLMAEMLRAVIDGDLLNRHMAGGWFLNERALEEAELENFLRDEIPRSVHDLVDRRLQSLSPLQREIIDCGAVVGRQLHTSLLRDMFPAIEDSVFLRAIKELLMKQVLEEVKADRVSFVHDKIREVVLRGMDEERRRSVHRQVATCIEGLSGERLEEHLYQLGGFWAVAGDAEKASHWYVKGARAAWQKFSVHESERLYRSALAIMPVNSPESLDIRLEILSNFTTLSETKVVDENIDILEQEAARSDDIDFQARVYLTFVSLYDRHGYPDKARDYLERLTELENRHDLHHLAPKILHLRSTWFYHRGDVENAIPLISRGIEILRQQGRKRDAAIYLGTKAVYLRERQQLSDARRCFEEAIAIMKQENMVRDLAIASMNLGGLLVYTGEFDDAQRHLMFAAEILRKAGSKFLEACSLHDLGFLYSTKADYLLAESSYEQAFSIFKHMGNLLGQATCCLSLANVCITQDRLDKALTLSDTSIELFGKLGNRRRLRASILQRATILRRSLRLEEAQATLETLDTSPLLPSDPLNMTLHPMIERGYCAIAGCQSASKIRDEIKRLIDSANEEDRESLVNEISPFMATVDAFDGNETDRLYAGELVENMPALMRKRILAAGQRTANGD